jgi:hypothetical protein
MNNAFNGSGFGARPMVRPKRLPLTGYNPAAPQPTGGYRSGASITGQVVEGPRQYSPMPTGVPSPTGGYGSGATITGVVADGPRTYSPPPPPQAPQQPMGQMQREPRFGGSAFGGGGDLGSGIPSNYGNSVGHSASAGPSFPAAGAAPSGAAPNPLKYQQSPWSYPLYQMLQGTGGSFRFGGK